MYSKASQERDVHMLPQSFMRAVRLVILCSISAFDRRELQYCLWRPYHTFTAPAHLPKALLSWSKQHVPGAYGAMA